MGGLLEVMGNLKALIERMNEIISIEKHHREIIETVKEIVVEQDITRGEVQRVLNGIVNLEELDKKTLFILADGLHKATDKIYPDFSLERYFKKSQINKVLENDFREPLIQTIDFPLRFENVTLKEDTYYFKSSVAELANLYNALLLQYNYKIHKRYKFKPNKVGQMVQVLDVDLREAKEICADILNKEYNVDTVVLNVLKGSGNEEKEIEYDEHTQTMVIKHSRIDIINGLMNIIAMTYVIDENPDFELDIDVEIKNCDLDTIKKYFQKLNLKGRVN